MKVSPFQTGELQLEEAAVSLPSHHSELAASLPSRVGDGMWREKEKSYLTDATMTFSALWLQEMLKADSLSWNIFVGSLHNPIGNLT